MSKRKMTVCPICDEMYDRYSDRAVVHTHPEPQSGPARSAFLASGMPYHRWIDETWQGRLWHREDPDRRAPYITEDTMGRERDSAIEETHRWKAAYQEANARAKLADDLLDTLAAVATELEVAGDPSR